MKLIRFRCGDKARLGAIIQNGIVPLDRVAPEFTTMRDIAAGGHEVLKRLRDLVDETSPEIDIATADLLPPIERPGKYLAIGMNYRNHIEEARRLGIAPPTQQLWFNKQTTCIAGPFDDINPGVTEKLDYEVELGVVIGKVAKYVSEQAVPDHIFGYVVANDVSARDWQFHSPTFTVGKSFDSHGPIGPCVVTADEIPNPHVLGLRCFVNGERRQESNTEQMLFNVWQQIAYLSQAFTLEPGDLIATGTPEGVGVSMNPPRFLVPGDVVRCEIDNIGAIQNTVASRRTN